MKKLGKIYLGLVLLFLYVPIFVLIVFSFNESKSRSVFSGFTLDWYKKLFQNDIIISSLVNTLIIAVAASIISTILGTLAAIGINNMRKVPKAIVMNITNMPIINPEIVTGVSLMLLFVFFAARMNLEFGFVTLLIAHITFDVPYVILNIMPKFRQMDPHLYEAAQDPWVQSVQCIHESCSPRDNARRCKRISHGIHLFAGRFCYQLLHQRLHLADTSRYDIFNDTP